MENREIADFGVDCLLKAGFEKTQCDLIATEKKEIYIENGKVSLLRTIFDFKLQLMGIKEDKRGVISINKLDDVSIKKAVEDLLEMANASQPDPDNDIAPKEKTLSLSKGPETGDTGLMYDRLKAFLHYQEKHYPNTMIEEGGLEHNLTKHYYSNSNGSRLFSQIGKYDFHFTCTSKKGAQTSSFDYTGFSAGDLSRELIECSNVDLILRNSSNSICTQPFPEKIVGDIIVTPMSVSDVLYFVDRSIEEHSLISGTSIYKEKLNQSIASPLLTIHSLPMDNKLIGGYHFTPDGFAAENSTYIDKGVLKNFMLGLIASNKTDKPLSRNRGGSIVVEPGSTSLKDMIKSVDKGILLGRFSGGEPSENGDFSGVAKNSFLIEDGKVKHALSETMISGNFANLINEIKSISKEQIDYGSDIIPWIQVGNITISVS